MPKRAVRLGLIVLAALAGVIVLGLLAAPLVARPVAERVLAAQVADGKARVGHAELAWFGGQGAVGVRLRDVFLDDGKGRPVLRARLIEAGLGLDSLALVAPGPSRLVVHDFFVAASVSRRGRYMLGYDAVGPPVPLHLDIIFASLTGKARRDRPLSYLRHADLEKGVVQLRHVGGSVAWKARVDKVAYARRGGRIAADSRIFIHDGLRRASLNGRARGSVGLKSLAASGSITDFTPARVFPAVSVTEPLSILNAPLRGRARIEYAAEEGITAAEVTGRAGAGTLRLGPVVQPLSGAQLVTRYDPAARQVVLQTLRLEAERTRLNMTGRLWLVPEKGRAPARLEYRLASPESYFSLNPTSPSQTLRNLAIAGSVTPEGRRLEIADLSVLLEGAPVRLSALLYGGKAGASPGVKADIAVSGPMSIQTLYAFWPEKVAAPARAFTTKRLHTATVLGSSVHADIPPGAIDKRRLTNPMLRVAFTYADGGVKVADTLPGIEQAVGRGVVQGNRFDLTMAKGRLGKLAISDAVVTVPRFSPGGAVASVRSRARGDLGDMLRLIDSPPLSMMGSAKMSPDRFSGPADLVINMSLPLRKGVTKADAKVKFAGNLHNLRIKDVTLGEDLSDGEMVTRGTLDRVDADGTAKVGPYRGQIAFWMPMKGADAGRKHITLDGKVGLLPGSGAPFQARINTRYGIGRTTVTSPMFNGAARWRKGEWMQASGIGQPAAWRQAGLPAGRGLPDRVPVRMAMTADGPRWAGSLTADAYSGALAYTRGNPRVIRYSAEITPAEADRIGVGELPMFTRTQPVVLTASVGEGTGSADYAVGPLDGRLEWSPGGRADAVAYGWTTTLHSEDLAGLGVPLKLAAPLRVNARGIAASGGLSGQADVAGAALRYDISAEREGRRQLNFTGSASDRTFAAVGLDVTRMMEGPVDFSGRLTRTGDGGVSGRLVGDFDRTALRIPDSGWSKPAGERAEGALDLVLADGTLTLRRITADGEGLSVRGSGSVNRAGVLSVNLPTARLDGFFDGAVSARSDEAGMQASVSGSYLDFRPILKEAQNLAGREGGGDPRPMRLDATLARVRVTDGGYVRDVKMSGGWGAVEQRRLDLTAATVRGSAIAVRAFPDKGSTALSLQVADLGDVAQSLSGYANLEGGATTGTGRIVPGGYDFEFEIRDMTMLRVPGAARLLARDGAIQFDRMTAPMRIRGSRVTLGDVVATGPSVGLTAEGIMDTRTRTMDVVGVVTPAYGLNGALGRVFGAPEGEGLFGVAYRATGPFTDPKIDINPLSLAAPGFLRRLFEPPTPTHPAP